MAENLFDVVFFPDTDPLSGAKKSYQKYLQFAVKMILLVVVFLPLLNRVSSGVDFFSLVEEFETYKAESGLTDMEGLEGLQNGYVEERSGYYQEHYGESE